MAIGRKNGFTIIEFLLYIGIAGIFIVIILPIISQITKNVSFYQSKINLRNEFSKVVQKITYESQIADRLYILDDWGIMFNNGTSSTQIRLTKPNLIIGSKVSGFAWGYNVGGIKLSGTTTNNKSYSIDRNSAQTCKISTNQTINSSFFYNGYGWSPNIGWINFRDNVHSIEYGVCEEANGDLRGFAWNDIIGWISFNCVDINVCGSSNYKVFQLNNRLNGYGYNDSIGWIRFDGSEEKIYLWKDGSEEQLTNNFVKAKNLIFENIGDTARFNLSLSNLDETKTIIGTTTIMKFGK